MVYNLCVLTFLFDNLGGLKFLFDNLGVLMFLVYSGRGLRFARFKCAFFKCRGHWLTLSQ